MRLGVDVGGTFTDAALLGDDGRLYTAKVTSTPGDQSIGVRAAVQAVLERAGAGAAQVGSFAHGMTVATNALLEGRTARTALLATRGFTDLLELGRQNRPHLYRLCEAQPAPLVEAALRFAVDERLGPRETVKALSAVEARRAVTLLAESRPEAVAIALLHSYRDAAHEQMLAAILAELLPGAAVSLSSELVGTFREYERSATTVLDAALSPLLGGYLRRLGQEALRDGLPEPQIMQSTGGLTESSRAAEHAALTVLSGPAGGVSGALLLCELAGEENVACFDMGGTSCDVCLIVERGVPETAARVIGGRPVALPALDIHTVGAGGGSIAWRDDGGALRVGPASAGAQPGPACYGRGGEKPTVTDANLLLGRLLEDAPLAGALRLDRTAAERVISALAATLEIETVECAEGIVRVAEAEMLAALRVMTVERGIDPRDFVLMPFGGAGPLHAVALARELGITKVLCPRASGVLSALGLAAAAPRRDLARTLMLSGEEFDERTLFEESAELISAATEMLGAPAARVRVRHELRYEGQSFELAVDREASSGGDGLSISRAELIESFARVHETRYGYRDGEAGVELVSLRVSVWGESPAVLLAPVESVQLSPVAKPQRTSVVFDGLPHDSALVRGVLAAGTRLHGPAICAMAESTLLVPPGWSGEADRHGTIHLRDEAAG
jgi:N-methylhydantoinase A